MWQIIGLALLALSALGFIAAHDANQQLIGEAKIKAQLAEQQAAQAQADKELAQKGQATAQRLLAKRVAQDKTRDAQATADAIAWRAASDERAKTDRQYALWRETRLPSFVTERLRGAVQPVADEPASPVVPARVAVPDPAGISSSPDDQSWTGRIRRLIGNSDPARAPQRSTVAK